MTDSEPEFRYPDGYLEQPYEIQAPPASYLPPPPLHYAPHYSPVAQTYWPVRPVGPRPRLTGLAWMAAAAGAAGLIGAVGVWGTVHGADAVFLGHGASIHGTEGGGRLTLVLSIAVVVLALVLMARTLLGVAISLLVCGTLIALISIANVVDIKAIAPASLDRYGLSVTIGAGLWLTVAAGLGAALAGLMAMIRGQRT
jgi:hypothetical protein